MFGEAFWLDARRELGMIDWQSELGPWAVGRRGDGSEFGGNEGETTYQPWLFSLGRIEEGQI